VPAPTARTAQLKSAAQTNTGAAMDMRKFSGDHFIKVADVRDGSIQGQIAVIKNGKFDKPDLVFETGDILSLNATNTKALSRAYGPNSKDWVGRIIEMFMGEVEFQGKMQPAVLVRPLSPPIAVDKQSKLSPEETAAAANDDMNEQIPF
jgi:hypothetical protein